MQFIGAKGITLFITVVLIACGTGFGFGLLIGRQYPVHNFQKYGETRFLLDPVAGKLCDPFKDPKELTNTLDHLLTQPEGATAKNPSPASSSPFSKYAIPATSPEYAALIHSDYPPACGK
jgi:hypothetical protein